MKKYMAPEAIAVAFNMENGILAGSKLDAFDKKVSGSGSGVGEQFTNKKPIWGNSEEGTWK